MSYVAFLCLSLFAGGHRGAKDFFRGSAVGASRGSAPFASQLPWPPPSMLMVCFESESLGGEAFILLDIVPTPIRTECLFFSGMRWVPMPLPSAKPFLYSQDEFSNPPTGLCVFGGATGIFFLSPAPLQSSPSLTFMYFFR